MEKLKEKVFGIIVIIALGIIFIPMFFTSTQHKPLMKKMPLKPDVASNENKEPQILAELKEKIQEKQQEETAKQEIKQTLPQVKSAQEKEQEVTHKEEKQAKSKAENKAQLKAKAEAEAKAKAEAEAKAKAEADAKAKEEEAKAKADAAAKAEAAAAAKAKADAVAAAEAEAKAKADAVAKAEAEAKAKAKAQEQAKVAQAQLQATKIAQAKPQLPKEKKHPSKKEIPSGKQAIYSHQGAWAVQLGTFAVPEHATTLVKKLRKQGFPGYSQRTMIEGRSLTIVFVGPIVRKEDAAKLITTLESKVELQGIIVHHTASR